MKRLLLVAVWIVVVGMGVWVYPRFLAHFVILKLKSCGATYDSIDIDYFGRFRVNGLKVGGIRASFMLGDVGHPKEVVLFSPIIDIKKTKLSGSFIDVVFLRNARILGKWGRFEHVDGEFIYGKKRLFCIKGGVFITPLGVWHCSGKVSIRGNRLFLEEFSLKGKDGRFVLSGSVPERFAGFPVGKGLDVLKGNYGLRFTDDGILLVGRGGMVFSFSGKKQWLVLRRIFLRYRDRTVLFEGSVAGSGVKGKLIADKRLQAEIKSYKVVVGNEVLRITDMSVDAVKVSKRWQYSIRGNALGGRLLLTGGDSWEFTLLKPKRLDFGLKLPSEVVSALDVVKGTWSKKGLEVQRAVFGRFAFSGGEVERLVIFNYPQSPAFVAEGVKFGKVHFSKLIGKVAFNEGGVLIRSEQGLDVAFSPRGVFGSMKGIPLASLGVNFDGYADGRFWMKGSVLSAELFVYGLRVGRFRMSSVRMSLVGDELKHIRAILPSGMVFTGNGKMDEDSFSVEGRIEGVKLQGVQGGFAGRLKLLWSAGGYSFSVRLFSDKNRHKLFVDGKSTKDGDVVLQKVVFDDFWGSGILKTNGDGEVRLKGSLSDVLKFAGLDKGLEVKGKGGATVVVKHPLNSPKMKGTIIIKGAQVYLKGKKQELLSNLNIEAEIHPDGIDVLHASGEMGKVEFSFRGSVKSLLHYPIVRGRLELSNLELHTERLGANRSTVLSGIYLKGVDVVLRKGCWVAGKDYRFLVSGTLRFKGFLSSPKMSGDLSILSGNMLFLGGDFRITRGTISFDFSNGYKPVIDVDAVSQMYGERVYITVNRDGMTSLRSASGNGLDVRPDVNFLLAFLPYNSLFQSIGKVLGFDWFTVGLKEDGKIDINIGKDIAYNLFLFYNYRGGVSSFNTKYLLNPDLSFSLNMDTAGGKGLSLQYSLSIE